MRPKVMGVDVTINQGVWTRLPSPYADNTFLPFALLAAKTLLPPGELILALKP